MQEVWAVIDEASLQIVTTVDLRTAYARAEATGFPPLFRLTDLPVSTPYRLVHRDRPGVPRIAVDKQQQVMVVSCPADRLGDGAPLLYLASLLLERQMQLAGSMSLVAACVALPRGAALLLGGTGAGKTSTAIALCLDWGGQLVGNDLCIVGLQEGRLIARTGSRNFFLRYDAVRRNLPGLLHLFDDAQFVASSDGWLRKMVVAPGAIGIRQAASSVPILGAYVIHVDDRATDLDTASADDARNRYALYENLARLIRGSAGPFLTDQETTFAAYLPSLDSEACFWRRVQLIDVLMRDIGLTYVAGPVAAIARWIAGDTARRAGEPAAPLDGQS